MTDFSDSSDVNPEEMARMVEDLDDLENTLLGGSLKKQDQFAKNREKETTVSKKKVAFKDFDVDDPLADLSSDDEIYDTKKPNLTNAKSNLVADLFGVKDSKPPGKVADPIKPQKPPEAPRIDLTKESTISTDNLSISMNKKPAITMQNQARINSQNIREKSFLNDDIVEDSQKLPNTRARKSTFMEDLFGTKTRPASSTMDINPRGNVPNPVHQNPAITNLSEPPKIESTKSSSSYILDTGQREPRRGRRNSPIISDPLGLFSGPSVEKVEAAKLDVDKKVESRLEEKLPKDDLPEWLGGAAKTKETKNTNNKKTSSYDGKMNYETARVEISTNAADPQISQNANETTSGLSSRKNETGIFNSDVSSLMGAEFDQQTAIILMQQQEHELRTATSLSRQNEQMTKIVDNQRTKLDEQSKMFNNLIKHQIERQSMLETQMKIQQARIDHYIKTLMSQPTFLPSGGYSNEKSINEIEKEDEKTENSESLLKKLELEKMYLENTVEILKEKHEKEIVILQESHEKQMSFLREGMEKLEKKMYQDCETLEIEYERKIDRLKDDKEKLEANYKEEIERLKKSSKTIIDEMSIRHSQNIELLQKEHAETMDEISRAKELEKRAIDKITSHKTDIDGLFERSSTVITSFENLQKKLEDKDEKFDETKVTYAKKQEENLQLLRDQLNLQQEYLVEERKRLMDISQKLDIATVQLTLEFKKNSTLLNDTEERLATRERALVRDKQLFDEQMKWERDHLQVIKEAWIKEQERQMKYIHDEREVVANERGKFQVFNSLKNNSDDMVRVELESAMKVAQESSYEANQERLKWEEKCRALDAEKRSLREKEKHLVNRAKELENLTQSAIAKREEGLLALKEAKRMEQRQKEQLGQLQIQLQTLARRENKRAMEKLAKERLATRICPAEKPEKDTEHVSGIHYTNERSFATNSHVSTHFKDVVDPHLLLLKLNLDNKLDTTDELLAAMQ